MGGDLRCGQGGCAPNYRKLLPANSLELYVCTYAIGHFVFQAVAQREPCSFALSPVLGFEHLAVPFYPRIPPGFVWPPELVLKTVKDFDFFAARWRRLNAHKPF